MISWAIAATGLVVACVAPISADPGVHGSPVRVPEILLSRQLMRQAGLRVGDVVRLAIDPQGTRSAEFLVVAQYEPTPDPMRFSSKRLEARLHLPDLLALSADPDDPLSSEAISALTLSLFDPGDAKAVGSAISSRAPGVFVRPADNPAAAGEVFAVVNRFHWAIAVVTVVGSTAFLLALMVIRAEERREVVGILRLMGISQRSILLEVLVEGLIVAVAGALFGLLVARFGEIIVNRFFQWRYDTPLVFARVTLRIAVESVALAVPLGVFAGLAASWTLLRRHVVSLIRR